MEILLRFVKVNQSVSKYPAYVALRLRVAQFKNVLRAIELAWVNIQLPNYQPLFILIPRYFYRFLMLLHNFL